MYRSGILNLSAEQMAIYTGSTLHEVAHVVGAGNAMDASGALHIADQATITKMIRVMLLAPVLVVMSIVLSRLRTKRNSQSESIKHNTCSQNLFCTELNSRNPRVRDKVTQTVGIQHTQDNTNNERTQRQVLDPFKLCDITC